MIHACTTGKAGFQSEVVLPVPGDAGWDRELAGSLMVAMFT